MGAGPAHKPSGNALITAVIVYVRLWHTSAETVVAEKGRLSTVPDEFLSLWPV